MQMRPGFQKQGGGDNVRVIITLILWILISITMCLPTRCLGTYPAHSAFEVPSCQRAAICLRDVHNPCHCVRFKDSGEKLAQTSSCVVASSSKANRDRVCSIMRPSCITVCDLAQKPHQANLCCVPCFSQENSCLLANSTQYAVKKFCISRGLLLSRYSYHRTRAAVRVRTFTRENKALNDDVY